MAAHGRHNEGGGSAGTNPRNDRAGYLIHIANAPAAGGDGNPHAGFDALARAGPVDLMKNSCSDLFPWDMSVGERLRCVKHSGQRHIPQQPAYRRVFLDLHGFSLWIRFPVETGVDFQLGAVLGYRAPGQRDASLLQRLGDGPV